MAESKMLAFRCPKELLKSVDDLAEALGVSRSELILHAMRRMRKEASRRGGSLVPPYKRGKMVVNIRSRGQMHPEREQERKLPSSYHEVVEESLRHVRPTPHS